jgi:pimeloyl-ACP methyl ester carboxylesterase
VTAALCLVAGACLTAGRAEATTSTAPSSRTFAIGAATLDYCGNGSVTHQAGSVRRVVLVAHGSSGNYCDYARYAIDAASAAGVLGTTLVVAPHFRTDVVPSGDPHLTWGSGWREGNLSANAVGARVSSFAALDQLAAAARQTYGAGVRLVVVGHSAGGQLVQRYAEGSDAPFAAFVPMNPSSYAYLGGQRWAADGTLQSVIGCSGYNTWKYDLEGLNTYLGGHPGIPQRYAVHRVALLLGGSDTERDADLDSGCEADLQGRNRLERGQRFFDHLDAQLGVRPTGHTLSVVPGVGHDGRSMLASAAARAVLFQ